MGTRVNVFLHLVVIESFFKLKIKDSVVFEIIKHALFTFNDRVFFNYGFGTKYFGISKKYSKKN